LTDAFDFLTEARWEQEGTRRAAERYREAAASKDPSALPSGQKLLREVVPALIGEITALKLVGQEAIAQGGTVPKWAWPLQVLESGVLAIVTVIRSMGAARGQADTTSSIATIALDIAASVRDEIDYRAWVSQEIEAKRAAKEAQDWEHKDLLRAFKLRYPQADRKTWKRWSKKLELAQSERWTKEEAIQLGAALISALVKAAPSRFEVAATSIGAMRTQSYLKLSEETMELMNDIEARAAVARPRLMPMLIKPLPWRYE
jgi:DNA-directed RNA polymerase